MTASEVENLILLMCLAADQEGVRTVDLVQACGLKYSGLRRRLHAMRDAGLIEPSHRGGSLTCWGIVGVIRPRVSPVMEANRLARIKRVARDAAKREAEAAEIERMKIPVHLRVPTSVWALAQERVEA